MESKLYWDQLHISDIKSGIFIKIKTLTKTQEPVYIKIIGVKNLVNPMAPNLSNYPALKFVMGPESCRKVLMNPNTKFCFGMHECKDTIRDLHNKISYSSEILWFVYNKLTYRYGLEDPRRCAIVNKQGIIIAGGLKKPSSRAGKPKQTRSRPHWIYPESDDIDTSNWEIVTEEEVQYFEFISVRLRKILKLGCCLYESTSVRFPLRNIYKFL